MLQIGKLMSRACASGLSCGQSMSAGRYGSWVSSNMRLNAHTCSSLPIRIGRGPEIVFVCIAIPTTGDIGSLTVRKTARKQSNLCHSIGCRMPSTLTAFHRLNSVLLLYVLPKNPLMAPPPPASARQASKTGHLLNDRGYRTHHTRSEKSPDGCTNI